MYDCRISTILWPIVTAIIVAGPFSGSASADEVDPKALLERMSAEINGLERFLVDGDSYTDARLDAGQIIEHSSHVTLRLQRDPGSVRITNRSAEGTKEIFFDDGLLSVYDSGDALYAQTEIPKGVESMLDFAVNEVGIESPMLDLVSSDISELLTEDAEKITYLGESLIRDGIYHHVGIRSAEVDVQVWVAAEGPPLPGKLVISSKWEGGAPRFVAFFDWNTDPSFAPDLFQFEPPEGAVQIDFLVDTQE